MAATSATKMFHNAGDVSRQEIQAAIAKAVELRALHAALMQGSSPSNLRFPSASPISQFSAQDYPVFTPSYEDEPTNGYHQVPMRIGTFSESWDEYGLGGGGGGGGGNEDETVLSDYKKEISKDFTNLEPHICPAEDHKHLTGHAFQSSPVNDYFKSSRRNSLGDSKSVSSCNRCRPAIITKETDNTAKNSRLSNTIVPLTDSHLSTQSQPKSRGVISRLFPRLKKKNKYENSPNRTESEDVSQIFKDLGIVSIETLKKELINANETRDAALMEVSEMKTSLGELRQKLEGLENYCEELKRALKQATNARDLQTATNLHKRTTSTAGMNEENRMPVSEEVMVEGFLQIVSEARLSVKQFCKTLVSQIEETDNTLMENLNSILQPYKLSLNSKYSRAVLYHLEAIINQALYQDFENCVFQKNGSPKLLDPHQDRQAQFSSFVALRNLSWNEVLRKGTKYYSEEFSKFCKIPFASDLTCKRRGHGLGAAVLLPIELTLMASLFNPNPPLVSFSSIRPSSFNPSKMVSNFNQTSIITNNTDVIAHTKLFSSSLSMATGCSSAGGDNTSRKLPVLLFDIMDTLVRDPFYDDVPAFFRMPMEELLELKDPTVWIEFEKGLIDEAELEKRFFKDERPIDFEGLKSCMISGYSFLEGIEELLIALKEKNYEMHAFTNYPVWYEMIEEKLKISKYLSWTFCSCKNGKRKPDPEFYLEALRHLKVEPANCIFVDDRKKNVEAAKEVGINGLHFKSADLLLKDLCLLGLDISPDTSSP